MTWRRSLLLALAVFVLSGGCSLRIDLEIGRPQPRVPVTRYAGPAGGGSAPCTTNSAPYCTMQTALTQMVCGDTLIVKDGTYQGSSQMLDPYSYGATTQCTSGAHMTVRAENDGGAVFDGQHLRRPIVLYHATYWDLSGMNARYGGPAESGSVVTVSGSGGATTHHITLKRIVAWDAGDGNDQVFLGSSVDNLLLEDVAGFGSANQICMADYVSTNVIQRRVWCRGEGSTAGRHVTVNQFNYYGNGVNPQPGIIENTIQTTATTAGLRNGTVGPNTGQIEWVTDINRDDALNPGVKYLGGMHYLMSPVFIVSSPTTKILANGYKGDENCTGYVIQDTIFHANGFPSQPLSLVPGAHNGCHNTAPGQVEEMTRVTTVTSGGSASGTGNAVLTNFIEQSTLAATGFNYIGGGNTARLCYQYINGVYQDGTGGTTAKPLWPWPMDDRIKAAIASNTTANGAILKSSTPLTGSAGPGYAANTVTSEIASVFGAIPSQCTTSGGPFVPPFPSVTDFPSTPLIDQFTRGNGAIGGNYTWAAGTGFTIASSQAVNAAGNITRGWYNAASYPAQHEVYAVWPVIPTVDTVLLTFGGGNLTDTGYHLILSRSGGTARLTVARIPGGYTEILGPIDLTTDVSNNQSFGIRVAAAQTINVYWRFTDGIWYRIGSVVDAGLPTSGVRIGFGANDTATVDDFGGGTYGEAAPNPGTVGRFGALFPKQ